MAKASPIRAITGAVKDVGSSINDARKDVTKVVAGGIADIAKPLGPAAVPLLTAALTASGVGAPLAAALAAGSVQGSRAIDATGSLNAGAKAGATSAALSGLSSLGGQALGNLINPYVIGGLSQGTDLLSATALANSITPILSLGGVTGAGNVITGNGTFGEGFQQGALTGILGQGGKAINGLLNPQIANLLGADAAKFITPALTAGTTSGVSNVLTGKGSFGEGFEQGGLAGGLSAGINGLLNYFGVTDPANRKAISDTLEGYAQKEFFSPDVKNALFGGAIGVGGAALANNLLNNDKGSAPTGGTTGTAPTGNTTGDTTGTTPTGATQPAPFNLGSLDIGRIGEAFTPKQNTSYADFPMAAQSSGLGAVPITPPAFNRPSYFNV